MVTVIIRCTFSANVSNQVQGDPSLRWAHTYVILQVLPSNLVFSHLTILYHGFQRYNGHLERKIRISVEFITIQRI